MRSTLVLCFAACACLPGQVRFSRDQIAIDVDGKPFTTFHYGADNGKPFLAPLRSASGKIVTRHFPIEDVAGESRDRVHHTGLWFSYDDVNGAKFWENDPSYSTPSHLLARARLRPVCTQSVWPERVRFHAGRKPVEVAGGPETAIPLARGDSPRRC